MAFVVGRQILDAIILAAETVDDYLTKKNKKGFITKTSKSLWQIRLGFLAP